MSWITLAAILVTWTLLGLGVAYLFGRFVQGAETPETASDLAPRVVSYLRRVRRAKTSPRATTAASHPKTRRVAGGGHRH